MQFTGTYSPTQNPCPKLLTEVKQVIVVLEVLLFVNVISLLTDSVTALCGKKANLALQTVLPVKVTPVYSPFKVLKSESKLLVLQVPGSLSAPKEILKLPLAVPDVTVFVTLIVPLASVIEFVVFACVVISSPGSNPINLIVVSLQVPKEALAAEELQNCSIELIDLQTVSPIDYDTIKNSLKKTKRLLVCQEAPSNSSVGTTVISKIVESELFHELEVAPKLISGLHSPMPSAKHLELNVIPQAEDITNAVKSML